MPTQTNYPLCEIKPGLKQYLRSISLRRDAIESFEHYPYSVPAIAKLDELSFHPKVTFFVGENGTGKSTLLEGIAVGLGMNSSGGNKNTTFSISTEAQNSLHTKLRFVRGGVRTKNFFFLRAESYFNLASYIDDLDREFSPFCQMPEIIDSYGGVSLHKQSHGESFLALLTNKLKGNGFYVFDEPEAALSPTRQFTALTLIHRLVEMGSQFVIATHSPILLTYPDAIIYSFDGPSIQPIPYEETSHYLITKDYLSNYKERLETLLNPENGI